jgi:hypothetical protein
MMRNRILAAPFSSITKQTLAMTKITLPAGTSFEVDPKKWMFPHSSAAVK